MHSDANSKVSPPEKPVNPPEAAARRPKGVAEGSRDRPPAIREGALQEKIRAVAAVIGQVLAKTGQRAGGSLAPASHDQPKNERLAASRRQPGRPRPQRQHEDTERPTVIHRDRQTDDEGAGLHTGSLRTGDLGGNSATTASAALAAAPEYVPSFPAAAPGDAPAPSIPPPAPSESAAGTATSAVAEMNQQFRHEFDAIEQRLTKLETDVQNALSQNANKA